MSVPQDGGQLTMREAARDIIAGLVSWDAAQSEVNLAFVESIIARGAPQRSLPLTVQEAAKIIFRHGYAWVGVGGAGAYRRWLESVIARVLPQAPPEIEPDLIEAIAREMFDQEIDDGAYDMFARTEYLARAHQLWAVVERVAAARTALSTDSAIESP